MTHRPNAHFGTRGGRPVKAVQVGGPLGAYIHPDQFDIVFDYEAYTAADALIGHGGITVDWVTEAREIEPANERAEREAAAAREATAAAREAAAAPMADGAPLPVDAGKGRLGVTVNGTIRMTP